VVAFFRSISPSHVFFLCITILLLLVSGFRNRCRQFPSLVNCTTIDWFSDWPGDALQEVASKFLAEESQIPDELKAKAGIVFAATQQSVLHASKRMQFVLKRTNYVTATNFLSLVKGYREMLSEKRAELQDAKNKLTKGLQKLDESRQQVEDMSIQLEERKEVVAQKNKECGDLLVIIVSERR
jgi:dynein heavy chain